MAEHLWTVLCGKSLEDPDTSVISLIDVVENLTVEGLEQKIAEGLSQGKKGAFVNAPMKLASWWFRSDDMEEVLRARFVFLNPAGETLNAQTVEMPWGGAEGTTIRLFVKIERFPVNRLGLYWFAVEQLVTSATEEDRWVRVARVPFNVAST
jgi:hypothetical protein